MAMGETQRVTVNFAGSITYDAAPVDCEGKPWPSTPQGHAEQICRYIKQTVQEHLMYEEGSQESADYVQAIHDVQVTASPGDSRE